MGVRRRSQDSAEARVWTRLSSPFWTFSLQGSSPDLPGPDMRAQGVGVPRWEGGCQEKKGGACPQHVSCKRLGTGGGQGARAHSGRSASGPSRALLSQTLPYSPARSWGRRQTD